MDNTDLGELRKHASTLGVFGKYISDLDKAKSDLGAIDAAVKYNASVPDWKAQIETLKRHRVAALAGLAGVIATLALLRPKRRPTIEIGE